MSDKLAYSVREASAALGISRATLCRLFASGQIPTFKIGCKTMMLRSSLEAFLHRATGVANGAEHATGKNALPAAEPRRPSQGDGPNINGRRPGVGHPFGVNLDRFIRPSLSWREL